MLIRCRDTLDLSRTSQTAASGGLHPQRTCLSLINALSFYVPPPPPPLWIRRLCRVFSSLVYDVILQTHYESVPYFATYFKTCASLPETQAGLVKHDQQGRGRQRKQHPCIEQLLTEEISVASACPGQGRKSPET